MPRLAGLTSSKGLDEPVLLVVKEDGVLTSNMNNKLELIKILAEKSLKVSKEPEFLLASGQKSNFYVDCKMTTLFSRGLPLIGEIFFERITSLNIKGIGGLTLGADPIATATAMVAGQRGIDLVSFVIRKESKKHGLMKWIEGGMAPGDRVVIIDDVITTGGSTIKAIDKSEEAGLEIVKVIVLVDREEGGRENILKRGYEVEAIFTKSELMEEHDRLKK